MKILKEVDGDLVSRAVNGEFDVIVHGCNCFCTMGKGIAAQIRDVFPKAYAADSVTKSGDASKLGTYTYAEVKVSEAHSVTVVNAYTQYHYWSRGESKKDLVDYEAVRKIFRSLNSLYAGKNVRVGVPKIGAGLAGGDWVMISKIITEETPDLNVTLVNFKPAG